MIYIKEKRKKDSMENENVEAPAAPPAERYTESTYMWNPP